VDFFWIYVEKDCNFTDENFALLEDWVLVEPF